MASGGADGESQEVVLVHLRGGAWEVRTVQEGYRALLDGVATCVRIAKRKGASAENRSSV
jgi:hypothetical protein